MPVYLVHGFRWARDGHQGIRVYAIVNNLEDCSVEYIQNTSSREEILGAFRKNHPDIMQDLDASGNRIDFIEQYDPDDLDSNTAVSQPYAYVADKVIELAGHTKVHPVDMSPKPEKSGTSGSLLSINIEEVIAKGPGSTPQAWEAFADLRDNVANGEKIGWWVVYNGDPERYYSSEEDDDEDYDEGRSTPTQESNPSRAMSAERSPVPPPKPVSGPPVPPKSPMTPRSTENKFMPIRNKPEAVLPSPKAEDIPEPTKAKEIAKSSGFRKKFFGKKI